jgi:Terminase large subunit, T4likevirus-type, N-terminal
LMPWQQRVADVALELDDHGQLVYRDVALTVPRQQGKSLLLLVLILTRALVAQNQHIAYCAQSALDAHKKLRDDWMPIVEQSALHKYVQTRYAPGDSGMRFPNGSRQSIIASTEKAGHGAILDLGIIDESFSYQDARIEQALRPAMMTRSRPGMLGAQLWVVSTAGTPTFSPYLWDKVARGRAAVDAGRTDTLAYFEWSARDDEDPSDPAVWRACMPALGTTVDEATVRAAQASMSRSEFARAFLNRWVTAIGDPIVPIEHWQNLAHADAPRPPWVVLGLHIAPRDAGAAIVAAGECPEGLQTSVVESGEGVAWLLDALRAQVARWDHPHVLLDEKACAHMLPEIQAIVGFDRLVVLRAGDVGPACAFWLRLAQESKMWHRNEPELMNALVGAAQRTILDAWTWSAAKSGVDISPLAAQTWAVSYWLGQGVGVEDDAP